MSTGMVTPVLMRSPVSTFGQGLDPARQASSASRSLVWSARLAAPSPTPEIVGEKERS